MAHWTATSTGAHDSVRGALKAVDKLLGYVKDTAGKPSVQERALFAAAIVFIYGIWENYVEQLAIELSGAVSGEIPADKVPDGVKRQLEKRSAWELAVAPGWRKLWATSVREKAVGDEGEKFGLNTAKAGQVKTLLAHAGVTEPFQGVDADIVPDHLDDSTSLDQAVNTLVSLRGEIVHTGKVPDSLRKKHVLAWRQFVEQLVDKVDESCRAQCKALGE